ncbi:MAG: phage tail protein [Myxococcales bacterium]|nr:phage tail protein [Myxococcales bacterium]
MMSKPHETTLEARVAALEWAQRRRKRMLSGLLALAALTSSATLAAQTNWAPPGFHVFSAGTPAVADEVNHNFRWVIENTPPPGTVVAYMGKEVPSGWLACEGQEVQRDNYPRLAKALGDTWDAASSSSQLLLPDLRGQFLRGLDSARGLDPDGDTREIGSEQGYALENITGTLNRVAADTVDSSPLFQANRVRGADMNVSSATSGTADVLNTYDFDVSRTDVSTSSETRPTNVAVRFIIKY